MLRSPSQADPTETRLKVRSALPSGFCVGPCDLPIEPLKRSETDSYITEPKPKYPRLAQSERGYPSKASESRLQSESQPSILIMDESQLQNTNSYRQRPGHADTIAEEDDEEEKIPASNRCELTPTHKNSTDCM